MSKLLYRCLTKATNREEDLPRRSFNWVISKRAVFKVYEDQIKCGSWNFPFSEISNAILYTTKSSILPGHVLKFEAKEKTYQFGFNSWAHPCKYFNFPYEEEESELGHSVFSIIARLFLFGYLIYIIVKNWF